MAREMSLVPARITTAAGLSAMTSGNIRTSICEVVCPAMPRLTYGCPGNDSAKPPESVIESPMNTTRLGSGGLLPKLLIFGVIATELIPVLQLFGKIADRQ